MSHWGSEKGGVREVRDWECCVCEKSAGQRARQKRLRLHWMCWWCVRLRSHKRTTFPPPGLYATDGENISERRTNSDIVNAGWAKLRTWKKALLDRVFLSSPLPRPHYTSSAVRCGVGDINQNKGVLRRGMSEPRLALHYLWNRAKCLSENNNSTSAARISRRSFPPQKGERRRTKNAQGDTQVGGYNVSSKPTIGK